MKNITEQTLVGLVPDFSWRVGIDFGAAGVKLAIQGPKPQEVETREFPHTKHPLIPISELLIELKEKFGPFTTVQIAVSGGGRELFKNVGDVLEINEVVASAKGARQQVGDARTVIDLGAQFSKWILLGEEGDVSDFATNGLCAAGSGAFLEQQASRLHMDLDELGKQANSAERGATIAGRCSVFAKSDMIHLQQKGTPVDEISYGLCLAMTRTFLSSVVAGRTIEAPLVLIGGGARNPGVVRSFVELLSLPVRDIKIPEQPHFIGAQGALSMADTAPTQKVATLIDAIALALERGADEEQEGEFLAALPKLPEAREEVVAEIPEEGEISAFLGIDVGSVSTNLVLFNEDYEVIHGIYLPTRGQPVEVLSQGMDELWQAFGERLNILGVGTTGSGRHLAAEMLGADAVHNEITAQALSSAYFVPDVDTIFEIGGQDSKYISVRDGHLADFEMNKICSAGTGSFLEEQAQRLGVKIIGEFAERAAQANRSPDLGTRCTVFMDAEMVRAQQRNASVDSICAGLAYSVARNYIEKVVAGRPIGEKILFQGGTASNQAVVAAFQELLGRPIEVHPHNRVSGAIGAALLAQRASELDGFETQFMGFDSHKGVEVQSFECKHCENRCQVNRIKIGEKTVHFGDACERFSARDRGRNAAHNVTILPNFFTKREELFNRSLENIQTKSENPEPIGLLRSSLNIEYQILWKTMLAELDYEAVLSVAASPKLLRDNNGGMPAELCLPIKVASAQTDEFFAKNRAERLFVPAVLECAPRPKGEEGATCIYAQELGDMLRARYGDKIATAKFSLEEGVLGIRGSALALAPVLNRPVAKIVAALEQGFKAHKEFIEARRELGREALSQDFDRAVIVIGRPYNTHDSYLNLSLSKHLERAGLVAIPWDLLPLEDVILEERWSGIPWHYNREQLRAIQWLQEDKRFFPLMVSSYGCGPDGFTTKYAEEMLGGFPRLFLEFDEHQAEAGLVTRIEAFSDEIAQYIRYDAPESQHDEFPAAPPELPEGPFIIPDSSEHAEILAAVFRKLGYEASVLLSPDSESIRMGEEHSSGRECHPYTILAGDLVRAARDIPEDESCTFMAMGCDTPCMMRQYGDSHRLLAHKLGRKDMRVWTPASPELFQIMGFPGIYVLNEGFISVDILLTLSTRLRPYEQEEGAIDKVFEEALRRISSAIEKSEPLGVVLKAETNNLMDVPRTGEPGERPVVGVTGDLYTRLNRTSNSNLVQQLEKMGCEVWLNSGLGALIEVGTAALTPRRVREGRVKAALFEGFTWAVLRGQRRILLRGLSERVHELAVEETGERQLKQAEPYVESASSYLVTQLISKSVDFFESGADGVVSAAGINCMVATSAAAIFPKVREDHGNKPLLTISYGSSEGPSQRIKLETFVHQVFDHHARKKSLRKDEQRQVV